MSVPLVVSSRLPGLMSLCTMPWLCRYSRPSTSCRKYLRAQRASGQAAGPALGPLGRGKPKGQDG